MTMRNVGFACLLNLIFLANIIGQDVPKPRLVDEFGHLGCCCDLSARMDLLFAELGANPGSIGYVVVAQPPTGTRHWRENYFDGYIRYRGFDEDRVVIVRKPGVQDALATEIWIVPPGSSIDENFAPEGSYVLNPAKQKLLFYDGNYGDSLCYNLPPFRLLAKYLRADPLWTANISIGVPTAKVFEQEKKRIQARFENEYDVDPNRLRFFRTKGKFYDTIHEIWLVRKGRREKHGAGLSEGVF
jgi:hypothetical protein